MKENKALFYFTALLILVFSGLSALAQEVADEEPPPLLIDDAPPTWGSEGSSPDAVTFVSLAENINDCGRFADAGPDSGWYVGFNNAWIVKLPPAPTAKYARAFLGAKIGRAKSAPVPGQRGKRAPLPGKVYIAISDKPAFKSDQSFFLAETRDLPLEADPAAYTPGTGASEWFWAEVPLRLVSSDSENFLIAWSPTDYFISPSSSPILAACDPPQGQRPSAPIAWNNHSLHGVAPRAEEGTLETPVHNLLPALAIKLVEAGSAKPQIRSFSSRPVTGGFLFSFSVFGADIDLVWLETSQDQLDWQRSTRYIRRPPYLLVLPYDQISTRGTYVRASAAGLTGAMGSGEAIFIRPEGQP